MAQPPPLMRRHTRCRAAAAAALRHHISYKGTAPNQQHRQPGLPPAMAAPAPGDGRTSRCPCSLIPLSSARCLWAVAGRLHSCRPLQPRWRWRQGAATMSWRPARTAACGWWPLRKAARWVCVHSTFGCALDLCWQHQAVHLPRLMKGDAAPFCLSHAQASVRLGCCAAGCRAAAGHVGAHIPDNAANSGGRRRDRQLGIRRVSRLPGAAVCGRSP